VSGDASDDILRRRLELETVLSTALCAALGVEDEEFDSVLLTALEKVGLLVRCDAVHLFTLQPDASTLELSLEWVVPGQATLSEQFRPRALDNYHWLSGRLRRLEVIEVPKVHQLPLEATAEKLEWLTAGVRSLVAVPMARGQRLLGYIGFCECSVENAHSPEMLELKSRTAKVFSALVESRQKSAERARLFGQMDTLGRQDVTTGLLNLQGLQAALRTHALAADRHTEESLIYLQIDRLDWIADSAGTTAVESVLRDFAERLKGRVSEETVLAHLGSGAFVAMIAVPTRSETSTAAKFESVADELLSALRLPFAVQGRDALLSGSVGIARAANARDSGLDIVRCAELAMKHSQSRGQNQVCFYGPQFRPRAAHLLTLETALKRALEKDRLKIFFQPVFDLREGHRFGAEALVRWQDPDQGWISPAEFIPVAEQAGLMIPLGEFIFRKAMVSGVELLRNEAPGSRISVNLSPNQFHQPDLMRRVVQALEESGLEPGCLQLEITEGALVRDLERTKLLLRGFHELGVKLSIDDFGTGYSSLAYLKHFPVDSLKIDQSFMRDVTTDSSNAAIVRATIALANNLNLRTVAEGVETREQLDFIKDAGCDLVQGYLLGRPVPPEEFASSSPANISQLDTKAAKKPAAKPGLRVT